MDIKKKKQGTTRRKGIMDCRGWHGPHSVGPSCSPGVLEYLLSSAGYPCKAGSSRFRWGLQLAVYVGFLFSFVGPHPAVLNVYSWLWLWVTPSGLRGINGGTRGRLRARQAAYLPAVLSLLSQVTVDFPSALPSRVGRNVTTVPCGQSPAVLLKTC